MSHNPFAPATRKGVNLRALLIGKSGGGKTYTALALACHTAQALGTKVAVVDTEDRSAEKYAGEACACAQCRGHGLRFAFDVLCLSSCSPQNYMDAMTAASANGYGVMVLDSISHEWEGPGGCLEMVDASTNRNKHAAWGPVTHAHNSFLAAIRSWPGHVFATVRGKEKHEKQGKNVVSLGVQPVQRDGIEYEFDLAVFLDGARGQVVKSRASSLSGWLGDRPGAELASAMLAWAGDAPPAVNTRQEPELQRNPRTDAMVGQPGFAESVRDRCMETQRDPQRCQVIPAAEAQALRDQAGVVQSPDPTPSPTPPDSPPGSSALVTVQTAGGPVQVRPAPEGMDAEKWANGVRYAFQDAASLDADEFEKLRHLAKTVTTGMGWQSLYEAAGKPRVGGAS